MNEHRWLDQERKCSCGWVDSEKSRVDTSLLWSLHKAEIEFNEKGYGKVENYLDYGVFRAYRECAEVLKQFNQKLSS